MRIRPLAWRALAPLAVVVLVAAACGKSSNDTASGASSSTGGTASTSTTGASGGSGSSGSGGGYGRYGGGNAGGGGGNGSSDDSGNGSSGDAKDVTITANDYAFSPTKATVKSGTELYLANANANTPHTFTIDGTDVDVSLDPMSNEDVKIDLDPGTYRFHCTIHPSMTGALTVT